MIERIADMPTGTVGLRASGKLTREDCVDVIDPALTEAGAAVEDTKPASAPGSASAAPGGGWRW